jgi:hypothetical protein
MSSTSNKCTLLAQPEPGLLVVRMNYWHRHPSGRVVRIGTSSRDASRWAIWLDGVLVSDDFGSAEEAAERANKHDFTDAAAVEMFRGIWVPWNLDDWRTSPPEPWTPSAAGGRN